MELLYVALNILLWGWTRRLGAKIINVRQAINERLLRSILQKVPLFSIGKRNIILLVHPQRKCLWSQFWIFCHLSFITFWVILQENKGNEIFLSLRKKPGFSYVHKIIENNTKEQRNNRMGQPSLLFAQDKTLISKTFCLTLAFLCFSQRKNVQDRLGKPYRLYFLTFSK